MIKIMFKVRYSMSPTTLPGWTLNDPFKHCSLKGNVILKSHTVYEQIRHYMYTKQDTEIWEG